ncbi:gamma-interferon-inducible lysosomal thiol reductase-like, partial [Cydia splendana]|uniref:gamma-interferon-inducible lysosomal thiol reductase-like n=1 Tax=Cydia splendana TaxID=1100963 RepID=UPI00300C111E
KSGDKVDVRLYYECLCPYCIDFYTTALIKTVEKLGPYIDLKTYPYGNAERTEENGKVIIECQHGEEECYGNKLHACAIDILKNTTRSVSYISCMMSGQGENSGSDDNGATRCGKKMGINAKKIIKCAKGKKGEELLEYYGKETDKDVPDREGVPWSLINGKYVNGVGELDKWLATICAALDHPPPQCKKL